MKASIIVACLLSTDTPNRPFRQPTHSMVERSQNS
jgi:hypothetical protein